VLARRELLKPKVVESVARRSGRVVRIVSGVVGAVALGKGCVLRVAHPMRHVATVGRAPEHANPTASGEGGEAVVRKVVPLVRWIRERVGIAASARAPVSRVVNGEPGAVVRERGRARLGRRSLVRVVIAEANPVSVIPRVRGAIGLFAGDRTQKVEPLRVERGSRDHVRRAGFGA